MRNIVPIGIGVIAGAGILRYMAQRQQPLLSKLPKAQKSLSGIRRSCGRAPPDRYRDAEHGD